MKAINNPLCKGCKHRKTDEKDLFCYMFKNAPDTLPCGQHDKFAEQRRINGELIKRNPFLIYAMMLDPASKEKTP